MRLSRTNFLLTCCLGATAGFSLMPPSSPTVASLQPQRRHEYAAAESRRRYSATMGSSKLTAAAVDVDTVALVVGQETYGFAIVCLGEAIWSFAQAPSMSQIKVLLPGILSAIILGLVSGPMVTSGDVASIGTGLWIATAVSIALGASYVARIAAPTSESPKELAALGVLVSIAGFFSFGQNLVVNGFVELPSISIPFLPMPEGDGGVDYEAIMSMKDPSSAQ